MILPWVKNIYTDTILRIYINKPDEFMQMLTH